MGRRSSSERSRGQKAPLDIPEHEIKALARCLLPEIQKFFESEEGRREFEEWKLEQERRHRK